MQIPGQCCAGMHMLAAPSRLPASLSAPPPHSLPAISCDSGWNSPPSPPRRQLRRWEGQASRGAERMQPSIGTAPARQSLLLSQSPHLSAARSLSTAARRASSSRAAGVELTSWRPRSRRSTSVLLVTRCRGGRHAASCKAREREGGRGSRRQLACTSRPTRRCIHKQHKLKSRMPACGRGHSRGGRAGRRRPRPCE